MEFLIATALVLAKINWSVFMLIIFFAWYLTRRR